jgi:geranylgeranyl reductase family protein
MIYDVAVIGAGPAGSTCAALCAAGGMRTLLLERATFPREKVCGDCLNPACWPILDRLGVSKRILALPHLQLAEVDFIGLHGRRVRIPIANEIAIQRSIFDQVLLERARELGADVRENMALTTIIYRDALRAGNKLFKMRRLVAADGRNSTVARLLGLLPHAAKDRVAVQAHVPAPRDFGERVAMQFHEQGYSGAANIGDDLLNLCLVARPRNIESLKEWARDEFDIAAQHEWRTVTPLARAAIAPAYGDLLLVGDAARVVEPFTGEGIAYALATGELAARALLAEDLAGYAIAHRKLYRGRLWINQLARCACLHPQLATWLLGRQRVLAFLTAKVTEPAVPKVWAEG